MNIIIKCLTNSHQSHSIIKNIVASCWKSSRLPHQPKSGGFNTFSGIINLTAPSLRKSFTRLITSIRCYHCDTMDNSNHLMNINPEDPEVLKEHKEDLEAIKKLIKFDDITYRSFPVEIADYNVPREVQELQSSVRPTKLKNPRLVCWSHSAAKSFNLDEFERNPLFLHFLAGSYTLPGTNPVAHNYCGHQFGYFAGQLGDGAAINLGEIVVNADDKQRIRRCFIQIKGAGLTPFSRSADGRKVLRSSIREFLCSEAMHYLGIPTTRALCVFKSDETVSRDMFYDGNSKDEYCAIVCRLAETFFRFGTFELFKLREESNTERPGPCVGKQELKQSLLDFTIDQYFQDINNLASLEDEAIPRNQLKYAHFFAVVIRETAKLVAAWESVGFCHGVLNTDNMSVKSLTIDYGPFGFMERFDRNFIPNTSDSEGRYRFQQQPEMVKWNLNKFAEALHPLLPVKLGKQLVSKYFMNTYSETIKKTLYLKLGFVHDVSAIETLSEEEFKRMDRSILSFFETMEFTHSDFTNTFRCLSRLVLPRLSGHDESKKDLLKALSDASSDRITLLAETRTELSKPQNKIALKIIEKNEPNDLALLSMIGVNPETVVKLQRRYEDLDSMDDNTKSQENKDRWSEWLDDYCELLSMHFNHNDKEELCKNQSLRKERMNAVNPRFILRNHVMQRAIESAEKNDFRMTNLLLHLSENPHADLDITAVREYVAELPEEEYSSFFRPPDPRKKILVSCSS